MPLRSVIPRILLISLLISAPLPSCAMDTGGEKHTAQPAPGRLPLDEDGRMQIGPDDRCPVCAMKVDKHKKFASAIQLQDGTTYYFCGTGCMIRSWRHPEYFLGADPSRLQKPVVREYFTGETLDARQALWVAGSDIVGPMGPALVPLGSEESLKAFQSRHGGKHVFRLDELTDEKWRAITGKPAVR